LLSAEPLSFGPRPTASPVLVWGLLCCDWLSALSPASSDEEDEALDDELDELDELSAPCTRQSSFIRLWHEIDYCPPAPPVLVWGLLCCDWLSALSAASSDEEDEALDDELDELDEPSAPYTEHQFTQKDAKRLRKSGAVKETHAYLWGRRTRQDGVNGVQRFQEGENSRSKY
jgi:hypothetical protein